MANMFAGWAFKSHGKVEKNVVTKTRNTAETANGDRIRVYNGKLAASECLTMARIPPSIGRQQWT